MPESAQQRKAGCLHVLWHCPFCGRSQHDQSLCQLPQGSWWHDPGEHVPCWRWNRSHAERKQMPGLEPRDSLLQVGRPLLIASSQCPRSTCSSPSLQHRQHPPHGLHTQMPRSWCWCQQLRRKYHVQHCQKPPLSSGRQPQPLAVAWKGGFLTPAVPPGAAWVCRSQQHQHWLQEISAAGLAQQSGGHFHEAAKRRQRELVP
mmetsp:Transcript_120967/g.209978  ORF Transcript_120967/g.209978 Transcript_120967/m.209978 type:complete len:202 (+) Transcript_120967:869-1474(+)